MSHKEGRLGIGGKGELSGQPRNTFLSDKWPLKQWVSDCVYSFFKLCKHLKIKLTTMILNWYTTEINYWHYTLTVLLVKYCLLWTCSIHFQRFKSPRGSKVYYQITGGFTGNHKVFDKLQQKWHKKTHSIKLVNNNWMRGMNPCWQWGRLHCGIQIEQQLVMSRHSCHLINH